MRLRLDTKDTVQYLYELYRANFDDPNRKIHIMLPTREGLYYFDSAIVPSTEFTNAVINGHFTLEDYNLMPGIEQTVMLLSVSVLHLENTPRMMHYFIRNNFLVSNLELKSNTIPERR